MVANVIPINARIGRQIKPGDRHGVLGMSARGTAVDYFTNAAARTGWGTPSLTEATDYNLVRLSYDYWLLITLYRNHWISRRIVDVPAQDMVRAWPRLTSEIDPEDLTNIDRVIRKTQTRSNILKTLKWARLFGGAGALIVIDGQENILDEPLDIDSIEIGAYKGLIPFDRWSGIQPDGTVSVDIKNPLMFNLPEFYDIWNQNGTGHFKVHASRMIRLTGPTVPQPELQAQMWWGISALEPAYEEIRKRDNMSWNILSLTYRANLIGIQFNELAQALSGASMNQNALVQFQSRMQAMNELMSNQSLIMLPKDGDMKSISYGFGGLGEVYQQFQMDIAGAAQIPVTRLFGRTLSGLGQSNDQDERVYEEMIALEQDDQLRPQLDMLYPVICMSTLGEVPKDLDLVFPSVRVLDDKEKSDLAKTTGDNIIGLFGAGLIKRAQALKEIKQSSDITGIGTNLTDEDIAEAEEQDKLQPLPPPPGTEEETEGGGKKKTKPGQTDALDGWDNFEITEFAGLPVTIEFQAGERRTIRNADGDVVYDRLMKHPYGFIRDTVGRDGDEIDVILGEDETAPEVFIIDMKDLGPDVDQREDEDKVCIGFANIEDARRAFYSMYPREFFGNVERVPLDEFVGQHVKKKTTDAASFRESEHPREKGGSGAGQFTSGSGGGASASPGSGKSAQIVLKTVNRRAFRGQTVETKTQISKIEAGKIGESVVQQWLRMKGLKDARPASTERNNYPVDLFADHKAIEVKTGLVSNGPTAQHWRATIGEPGEKEKKWLSKATPEAKRAWNEAKAAAILKRKEAACKNLSKKIGKPVSGMTVTSLLNPDTKTVDIYQFKGFHSRIVWNSDQARKAYVGSFKYE